MTDLQEWEGGASTGLLWLRIGTGGGQVVVRWRSLVNSVMKLNVS